MYRELGILIGGTGLGFFVGNVVPGPNLGLGFVALGIAAIGCVVLFCNPRKES